MGFIIRGCIWDIPILIFAYVFLGGPLTLGIKITQKLFLVIPEGPLYASELEALMAAGAALKVHALANPTCSAARTLNPRDFALSDATASRARMEKLSKAKGNPEFVVVKIHLASNAEQH